MLANSKRVKKQKQSSIHYLVPGQHKVKLILVRASKYSLFGLACVGCRFGLTGPSPAETDKETSKDNGTIPNIRRGTELYHKRLRDHQAQCRGIGQCLRQIYGTIETAAIERSGWIRSLNQGSGQGSVKFRAARVRYKES